MSQSAMVATVLVAAATFVCQKSLANIIAGIILQCSRPFKKGDKISVKQNIYEIGSGKVLRVGIMYTKIENYNRDVMLIPNIMLTESLTVTNSDKSKGVNYTQHISFSLESDHKLAKALIADIVINDSLTSNTAENTDILCKIKDGKIIFTYNVRTKNSDTSFKACSEIYEKLLDEIAKHEELKLV